MLIPKPCAPAMHAIDACRNAVLPRVVGEPERAADGATGSERTAAGHPIARASARRIARNVVVCCLATGTFVRKKGWGR